MSTSIDRAPARSATRDLAQIAVFAALIVVLGLPGQISIGSAGVPITLQTLGVMLAGALLGWRKGALSVLAVMVIGLALPVLAGGRTTLTALASPTAGFLIGWLPAVIVIGLLTGQSVVLAESPANLALLAVSLLLSLTTFSGPRVTALHGATHLVVFALYGLAAFAPA